MIEELIERWESAEVVDEIRKGDEYIRWERSMVSVAISGSDFPAKAWNENVRLIKRRSPQVPDDVLVIMATYTDGGGRVRFPLIRNKPGDSVWYDAEENGFSLEELEDIRAMSEVGEYL